MRLSHTLDHLGLPRFHHHKGHGSPVVLIEAPREHHHGLSGAGRSAGGRIPTAIPGRTEPDPDKPDKTDHAQTTTDKTDNGHRSSGGSGAVSSVTCAAATGRADAVDSSDERQRGRPFRRPCGRV